MQFQESFPSKPIGSNTVIILPHPRHNYRKEAKCRNLSNILSKKSLTSAEILKKRDLSIIKEHIFPLKYNDKRSHMQANKY